MVHLKMHVYQSCITIKDYEKGNCCNQYDTGWYFRSYGNITRCGNGINIIQIYYEADAILYGRVTYESYGKPVRKPSGEKSLDDSEV